jgi:hypothetical protein
MDPFRLDWTATLVTPIVGLPDDEAPRTLCRWGCPIWLTKMGSRLSRQTRVFQGPEHLRIQISVPTVFEVPDPITFLVCIGSRLSRELAMFPGMV